MNELLVRLASRDTFVHVFGILFIMLSVVVSCRRQSSILRKALPVHDMKTDFDRMELEFDLSKVSLHSSED